MQRSLHLPWLAAAGAFAAALWAGPAAAHIDLIDPPARAHGTAASGDPEPDQNSDQKSGPCGQITNQRTDRVTTYAPGETITVRVNEETNHNSYLRVSLDLDGDDDFPLRTGQISPETQEQAQAAEEALGGDTLLAVVRENNNANNFVHEIDVTLPDETCDNCTLQVIQLMYDTTQVYYFQCADIRIADGGAPAEGDAGAAGSAGAGEAGSGGSDGSGGSASGAGGSATTGSGGGSSSAGAAGSSGEGPVGAGPGGEGPIDPVDPADSEDDGGGCSLSSAPGHLLARSGAGWLGLGLAALLAGRRRSERARRAR